MQHLTRRIFCPTRIGESDVAEAQCLGVIPPIALVVLEARLVRCLSPFRQSKTREKGALEPIRQCCYLGIGAATGGRETDADVSQHLRCERFASVRLFFPSGKFGIHRSEDRRDMRVRWRVFAVVSRVVTEQSQERGCRIDLLFNRCRLHGTAKQRIPRSQMLSVQR